MKKMVTVFSAVLLLLLLLAQTAMAAGSLDGTTWTLVALRESGTYYDSVEETIRFPGNGAIVWTDANGDHNGTYSETNNGYMANIFNGTVAFGMEQLSNGTFLVFYNIDNMDWLFEETTSSGTSGGVQGTIQSVIEFLKKNWWLPVGLVGGYIVRIYFQKKQQPAASPPSPVSPTIPIQQPAFSGASSLICTKGQYAGATFPINGSLSIGRDPSRCQLVFPNEAKGISSLHCQVSQQGYGVTVTDMGSTYGTVVMGRKLNANETAQLKPGDSFYLADGHNEFKVL